MEKYCENCGVAINENSLYCSNCGHKQNVYSNNMDSYKDVHTDMIKNYTKGMRVEIPNGHHLCAYCENIKADEDFWILQDDEFCMCNKCHKRSKNIRYYIVLIYVILVPISIAAIIIDDLYHYSNNFYYYEDVFGALTVFILLLPFIYLLLDKVILRHTSLRISLSNRRKEKLRTYRDVNGNNVFIPIIRTEEENKYREITGIYRSRDVPHSYFRCPSCDTLHHISESYNVNSSDTSYSLGSRGFGGTKLITKKKEYGSKLCQKCHKFYKYNNIVRIVIPIIGVVLTPILGYLLDDHFMDFLGLYAMLICFGGVLLSGIISFINKLIFYIIFKRKLFYSYETAAWYGALSPRK